MKLSTTHNALIIFTRNPELGKVKTRLAKTIGDNAALEIYKFLISHTVKIATPIKADKFVFYSEKIQQNDYWDSTIFNKELQNGGDLGERMKNAFKLLFDKGYKNILIIGSDIFELTSQDIEEAYATLNKNNFVIGPALDGGYYLLGMNKLKNKLFSNKNWGTETVLSDSLLDLKNDTVALLSTKNDIDIYDDLKNIDAFHQYFVSS